MTEAAHWFLKAGAIASALWLVAVWSTWQLRCQAIRPGSVERGVAAFGFVCLRVVHSSWSSCSRKMTIARICCARSVRNTGSHQHSALAMISWSRFRAGASNRWGFSSRGRRRGLMDWSFAWTPISRLDTRSTVGWGESITGWLRRYNEVTIFLSFQKEQAVS